MSFINSFAGLAVAALMSGAVITGAEAADRHYGGGFAESKARLAIVNARISNQKRRIRFGLRTRRLNSSRIVPLASSYDMASGS